MSTLHLKSLLAAAILLLLLTLLPPVWAGGAPGYYQVSVLTDLGWWNVGRIVYGQDLTEQLLGLPRLPLADPVRVRVTHKGDTAAHIDTIRLGDEVPIAVDGADEPQDLAVKKLAAHDYDLIDAKGRTLELTFEPGPPTTYLALTARIEPEVIPDTPFRFPLENIGNEMTTSSSFYEYELGSRPGALTLNGELADEDLGEPFFVEFSASCTGHPSTDTYGYVMDDGEHLYAAIDFVGDNTLDGDKDYSAIYAVTASGLRRFEASVSNQAWGTPGFTYTDAGSYQHKVYEYRIPFAELDVDVTPAGEVFKLAFEAYGTNGTRKIPTPSSTREMPPPVGGHTVEPSAGTLVWLRAALAVFAAAVALSAGAALIRRRQRNI